ncbi:MAG: TolC family protein [Verrucomicrobia bacterium]|nr:TolC family protein [Verrucomicrobiota bacterium]MCH8525971.1 TolC family protein [Kiritimatiellia bacterium]
MKTLPLLLGLLPLLAQAEPLSLPDFLNLMETRNPDLHAAAASVDAADAGRPLARALPDPEVSAMFETMGGETDLRRIGISQTFPARGMRDARQQMSRAETDAARARQDQLRVRLRGEVIRRWADLAALDAETALQQERIGLWEDLLATAQIRVRAGAPARDLWRAQDRLAMAGDTLETLKSRRNGMAAALTRIARTDPGAPLTLPDPTDPTDRSDRSDQTPTLRLASAMQAMADSEARMVRTERRPMVMLMLEQEFAPSGGMGMGEDATMASVGLSIPLWPGKNRARIERAEARQAAAAAEALSMEDMQDAELHMLRADLADARRRLTFVREDLLPRAENTLAVTRDAYRAGNAPFTDLLEAEDRLLQLRLSEIFARRDALRAAAGLETLGFTFDWSTTP